MAEYRHFKVVVAGDNAEELMLKYDANVRSAPYVTFEYEKAEEYKKNYLKTMQSLIGDPNCRKELGEQRVNYIKEEIKEVEKESAEDFYMDLTRNMEKDPETMNAISTDNPNGRFFSHKVGGGFSLPFILKDGTESYKARKCDIAWEKIHLANTRAYEVAWDTTHGLAEPNGEDEQTIYENMKNMDSYFANFEGREHYISAMTAFWGLAFVDEKSGWNEMRDDEKQFDWVINFYDRFIKPLPEDTMLTIYECNR